jgi:hypothetical protein
MKRCLAGSTRPLAADRLREEPPHQSATDPRSVRSYVASARRDQNGLPGAREAVKRWGLRLVVQQPKHWSGELPAMTLWVSVSGWFWM